MVSTDFPYATARGVITQGGGGACIAQLVEALLRRGHKVTVVTRAEESGPVKELFNIPIIRTRFAWLGFRESKITHSLFSLPALFRVLASGHFDLIHAHNPAAALPSILAARWFCLPLLLTMHGPWASVRQRAVIRWLARRIEHIALLGADHITADSHALLNELVAIHHLSRSKFTCIPNAVDTTMFSPEKMTQSAARRKLGLPAKGKVVLFTGRFVAEKGLPDLLEAASILLGKGEKFTLLLIGGGFDEHVVRDWLARHNGFRNHIIVKPYVAYENMPIAYIASDVFALPSLAEGMSRSLMEAVACGRPVIATDVGGNPEIVQREFGMLVPPRNPPALAEAIHVLLADEKKRKKMGMAARAFAQKHLSIAARVRAFEKIYEKLVAGCAE